jgi:hypothetical protein
MRIVLAAIAAEWSATSAFVSVHCDWAVSEEAARAAAAALPLPTGVEQVTRDPIGPTRLCG